MFLKYKKNFYSQNGEDGIILEVLKRLKIKNKELWCCEFGAWDGIHGSNTFNLVKNNIYCDKKMRSGLNNIQMMNYLLGCLKQLDYLF